MKTYMSANIAIIRMQNDVIVTSPNFDLNDTELEGEQYAPSRRFGHDREEW